jgi:hypothetical protein
MLKVKAIQWLRYRTQFKLPSSYQLMEAKSLSKIARFPIIQPIIGRSIGTQTEAVSQNLVDLPLSSHTAPTPAAAASVTAAFQDLLGVSAPNTVDDLENTFYQRELPKTLVRFASPEGKKLFREAMDNGHAEGFFPLTGNFTTQSEPAYCGPSSCKFLYKVFFF